MFGDPSVRAWLQRTFIGVFWWLRLPGCLLAEKEFANVMPHVLSEIEIIGACTNTEPNSANDIY